MTKFKSITMTDNAMPILVNSPLSVIDVDLEKISYEFWNNKTQGKISVKLVYTITSKIFDTKHAKKFMSKKVDTKRCVACGKCVKNCPVDNITMKDYKLNIGESCAECFGCIHICPVQAVYIRRIIKADKQYINEKIESNKLNI